MSAQVCSPGLAPAPARLVTQAPLGCPGPCPAPAGASHTGTFHSTPPHCTAHPQEAARLIR